jgi:hypothetical protein
VIIQVPNAILNLLLRHIEELIHAHQLLNPLLLLVELKEVLLKLYLCLIYLNCYWCWP